MCGIIGILGDKPVVPLLIEALKRLEYRGYDSAGIATLVNGGIDRRRAQGKLENLEARLQREPLCGTVGIGHTRWATHGRPNEANAHPHANERVAVVHNGIIENFRPLRAELEKAGRRFETETDTEAVAHLLAHYLDHQMAPEEAVMATLARLEGAFALAIIFAGRHDFIIGARRGSPLAVGYGEGGMFLGSDALALAPLTSRICYLEEGDWTVLAEGTAKIFDAGNRPVERPVSETRLSGARIGKGSYRHFMQKEIFEQPTVIGDTLHRYLNPLTREVTLPDLGFDLAALPRLTISACGTAFYAGLVGKYWLESLARLPVEIDVASEFRYRERAAARGRCGAVHLPVGRDDRHPGGAALCQVPGPADPLDRQPAGKHDRARSRHRAADPGRSRDRRRLDQGLHDAVDCAGLPGDPVSTSSRANRAGAEGRAVECAH